MSTSQTSQTSPHPDHPLLTLNQVGEANRGAQRDGVFAGMVSGLVATIISAQMFRLNRKLTLFSGLLTGTVSGYFWTQAFLESRLALLTNDARNAALKREIGQDFEGGSGGQEDLRDQYATTRGDH
ncbi:hypothetical protein CALCODRAFT_490771 [Calocera cornea HHB12733]|uniref:Uncharacterized protein n=1 Tax=Calocera cornea HHB12733 TaxID=1353952 RepID=A0A165JHQ5_9BASI|nr:hypothetical protein CALCODRAFT_490771 [Calocera cornea HHB12733]